jgi:hypothetical protein
MRVSATAAARPRNLEGKQAVSQLESNILSPDKIYYLHILRRRSE